MSNLVAAVTLAMLGSIRAIQAVIHSCANHPWVRRQNLTSINISGTSI